MYALYSGHWSVALLGQRALTIHLPLVFHSVLVAAKEHFWNVQAAEKNTKMKGDNTVLNFETTVSLNSHSSNCFVF